MKMLLAPLAYWRIHHPVKRRWDYVVPTIGAIALTSLTRFWPLIPAPFGTTGYLASLQSLYAILGGFFVAALTLLSTADSRALKQPLSGSPRITFGTETAPLERRRFLCLLFGYLSFSCFGLFGAGFAAQMLDPGLPHLLPVRAQFWIETLFLVAYNFWLTHMFVSTLVGLYYFTDRLQRPDAELIRDRERKIEAVAAE